MLVVSTLVSNTQDKIVQRATPFLTYTTYRHKPVLISILAAPPETKSISFPVVDVPMVVRIGRPPPPSFMYRTRLINRVQVANKQIRSSSTLQAMPALSRSNPRMRLGLAWQSRGAYLIRRLAVMVATRSSHSLLASADD
jgi:hypothetical protein